MKGKRRAVFFDRDGTLCEEMNYLNRWEDFRLLAGLSGLEKLKEKGFLLVGVTNQSGIARGIISPGFVEEVSRFFMEDYGFDAFYHCPHHPDEGCSCRKPSAGMLLKAAEDLDIDLASSYMIGDRQIDVETAINAGARGILVRTGYDSHSTEADFVASGLHEAVDFILKKEEEGR